MFLALCSSLLLRNTEHSCWQLLVDCCSMFWTLPSLDLIRQVDWGRAISIGRGLLWKATFWYHMCTALFVFTTQTNTTLSAAVAATWRGSTGRSVCFSAVGGSLWAGAGCRCKLHANSWNLSEPCEGNLFGLAKKLILPDLILHAG